MSEADEIKKYCDFCHSEEGKERPIGRYKVVLKPIEVLGSEKMACQSCHRKTKRMLEEENKKSEKAMNIFKKFKNLSFIFFSLMLIMLLVSGVAYAQSSPGLPAFPSNPDPTPIDGGLGLLAAAGGAYAIKRLRNRKQE